MSIALKWGFVCAALFLALEIKFYGASQERNGCQFAETVRAAVQHRSAVPCPFRFSLFPWNE